MWTLVGQHEENTRGETGLPDHSFLILSRSDSTLVLRTEEEISELEDSGFETSTRTIFSGNVANNRLIMQVNPGGVKLLEGTKQIQFLPITGTAPLVSASLADPYLVALAENGGVYIYTLTWLRSTPPRLTMNKPPDNKRSRLQTICTYCDVSGLMTKDYLLFE